MLNLYYFSIVGFVVWICDIVVLLNFILILFVFKYLNEYIHKTIVITNVKIPIMRVKSDNRSILIYYRYFYNFKILIFFIWSSQFLFINKHSYYFLNEDSWKKKSLIFVLLCNANIYKSSFFFFVYQLSIIARLMLLLFLTLISINILLFDEF